VKEAIETDGVIRHGLEMNLINQRALARYIQVATHEKYSFEAILSAIRRYPTKEGVARRERIGKMILKLSTKNKVVEVSMRNRPEIQLAIARFAGEINYTAGETFWLVSTPDQVGVTIDSKNEAKLSSHLTKQDILGRLENLAEIEIEMSDILHTPGVLSLLTTQLKINDVNIIGMSASGQVSGTERVMIAVDQKDLLRAYQSLERLSKVR
jgi:aspartokinase